MKNILIILILALTFIHGVNAGKIIGTIDSTKNESMPPMPILIDLANGPGEPIPVDPAEGPLDRELESENELMPISVDQADGSMNLELIAMNSSSKYLEPKLRQYNYAYICITSHNSDSRC